MNNYIKVGSASLRYRLAGNILAVVFVGPVIALVISILVGLFANSLEIGIAVFFISWILIGIGFIAWSFIEYHSLGYLIEGNSISLKQGFFQVHKVTIPYSRITNISFKQNILERMFSTGDVIVNQEDSDFKWDGIDFETADKVIKEISQKSNVQPIAAKSNS